MRAFLLTAPKTIEMAEVERPQIADTDVLCRTLYKAISPGTYLLRYLGIQPGMKEYPFVPGYLNVAEVVEVGPAAADRGFAPGDTVHVRAWVKRCLPYNYCNGTDTEYVVVPGGSLSHVTHARRNPRHLAFAIFGHLGMSAAMESRCGPGASVLVVGQGILGLGCTRAFALCGAQRIAVVDSYPRRLDAARRLGATHTYSPGEDLHRRTRDDLPERYDVVVEASGNPKALDGLGALSATGDVYLVSLYPDPATVTLGDYRNRRIIGLPRDQWWLTMLHHMLDGGLFMVDEIISDVIPATIEDMRWAYEALLNAPQDHLGILVDWTGETTRRQRMWT